MQSVEDYERDLAAPDAAGGGAAAAAADGEKKLRKKKKKKKVRPTSESEAAMGMGIEDVDGDGGDGGGASPPSASTAPEGLVMGGEDEEEIEAVFEDGMLSCAGKDWTEIPRRVAELYGAKAKRVDLCYNEIVSLKYIDQFTECEELILDNNCLGDSAIFPSLPLLNTLTLNKNQIADTEAFLMQIKTCYPKLSFLSLLGNTACPNELVLKDEEDYQRYRYFVLHSLPGLRFLDSRAVTDAERAEAIRVGKFMKVVTISSEDMDAELRRQAAGQQQEVSQFSPLPQEAKSAENHKGTIGTCKYVYFGRHSEGNRFIRNNDL